MKSITNFTIKIILAFGFFASLFLLAPQSADACSIALNSNTRLRTAYNNGGEQPDGFFSDDSNPPFVYLDLDTEGCADETLYFTIFGLDAQGDIDVADNLSGIPISTSQADASGNITVTLRAGHDLCFFQNDPYDCLVLAEIMIQQEEDYETLALVGNLLGGVTFEDSQSFAQTFGGGLDITNDGLTGAFSCSSPTADNYYYQYSQYPTSCGYGGTFNEQLVDYYNSYPGLNFEFITVESATLTGSVFNQEYRIGLPGLWFNCPGGWTCSGGVDWQQVPNGILPYGETHPDDQGPLIVSPVNEAYQEVYAPLAPLPFPGLNGGETPDFGEYLASIFKAGIIIVVVLSVLMIVANGISYMFSGSIGKKMELRDTISNSVIGLLIALGSWLLLNTISPNLASDLSISIPNVSLDPDVEDPAWAGGNAEDGTLLCKGKSYHHKLNGQSIIKGVTQWPSDGLQRNLLLSSGVSVNQTNNCAGTGYPEGCTSMYFPNTNNVTERIVALKNACDQGTDNGSCTVQVTAGSECWLHTSHGPDKKNIDISPADANLNAWIVDNATSVTGKGRDVDPNSVGFPDNGKNYKVPGFGKFKAEYAGQYSQTSGAHWHVTFD